MKKNFLSLPQMWKHGISITAGLCAAVMLPALALSAKAEDKPFIPKAGSIPVSEENYSLDSPFNEDGTGTAGSQYFRIPAVVTLENGDLLATADARWATTSDGGGLDTIASVSSDGGNTWYYSFPFYFPDSDGYAGKSATTIIDPGTLVGPDGTIYCFADVNPTGSTTLYKTIGTGTGYVTVNGGRYLALTMDYGNVETEPSDTDLETYPYYVGDFDENGYAKILKREDSSETGYGVDEWYNLYTVDSSGNYVDDLKQTQVNNSSVEIQQNAFYQGSKFHVYSIGYIWVITSKDNGRTWEHPQNINDQIKRQSGEHAILVSPGKGITTSCGDIVIGFYDHGGTGNEENASIGYSTDNGKTWKRTNDVTGSSGGGWWSSENEIVELEDGTLRMFFRNGTGYICYADAVKDPATGEYTMGNPVRTTQSAYSGCNVTALSYSKKINGKQAILVACPTNSGSRSDGKIFTYLVEDDNTMTLLSAFPVPQTKNNLFNYSCLTELQDGTVGLLWETSWNDIVYDDYNILDICPEAMLSNVSVNVNLDAGETYTRTYNGSYTITENADAAVATLNTETNTSSFIPLYDHISDKASSLESFSTQANTSARLEDAEFTFTGSGTTWQIKSASKNLYLVNDSISSFFTGTAADMTVAATSGQDTFRICKATGKRYVIFYAQEMNFNANTNYSNGDSAYELTLLEKQDSVSADDILPGYKKASSITSGKNYLISYLWEGRVAVLYPQNGKANQTKLAADEPVEVTKTALVIRAAGAGYTSAVVDSVKYIIHVTGEYGELSASCPHSSTTVKGAFPASCTKDGYTGDEVCDNCGGIVKAGTSIAATGHDWDEGAVTKDVTTTENGELLYTCKNDAFHTKTEVIYSSAYNLFLEVYKHTQELLENSGLYTPESLAALNDAYEAGIQIETAKNATRAVMYRNAADMQDAQNTLVKKSSDTLHAELREAIDSAQTAPALQGDVPDDVWNAYTAAYEAASGASSSASADELWKLLAALTKAQEDLDAAKSELAEQARTAAAADLAAAVKAADAAYSAGQGDYTPDSWKAFTAAYQAAKNPPANADAAALRNLMAALKTAQSKLAIHGIAPTPVPDPGLRAGDTTRYRDMQFKVLNAEKKTAALVKTENKNKTKITVPATVTINGVSCKVTQISAKAFQGCSRLKQAVIGKNVTTIGKQAFGNCRKLSKITLKGTALKSVKAGAFKKTAAKVTVTVPKKLKKAQRTALLKKMTKAGMAKKSVIK